MTGRIIHTPDPNPDHTCHPPANGRWGRNAAGTHPMWVDWHYDGTIWQCDGCGRTWVATPPDHWRPEGRIARWRRHRAEQRTVGSHPSGVIVLPPTSAPKDRLPPSAAVGSDPGEYLGDEADDD